MTPDASAVDSVLKAATPQLVGDGETILGMKHVQHTLVQHTTGDWVVCRTRQQPSCARLLDVAAALRDESQKFALAILQPPENAKMGPEPAEDEKSKRTEYLRKYQTCAWHGCNIAFVLDDGQWSPEATLAVGGLDDDFNTLVADIDTQLTRDRMDTTEHGFWMKPDGSRELEGLVRISMHRALNKGKRQFVRHIEDESTLPKTYAGFWRSAEADGVWTRTDDSQPKHIALEVKMDEDADAPLCQVVDHYAHAGAVVLVRSSTRKSTKRRVSKRRQESDERLRRAMKDLEANAHVRYIDIPGAL